jgi:predicted transport protein
MLCPEKISNYGNGDYEIDMKDDSQLEYILNFIKESINQ